MFLCIKVLSFATRRRTINTLILLFSACGSLWSQFDGQFSQYMNNLSLINPAYVGEQTMIQTSLFQRTQWIGMPGAPIVSTLIVDSPFKLFGQQHGVGVHFLSDVFGVFNNQQIRLMYAYKRSLGKGHISFGVNLGAINIICYGDSINISRISQDDGYHTANDPIIPIGTQTGMAADIGLGVQYFADNYRVGFSLTHINTPQIYLGENLKFKTEGFIQVHGGYDFITLNPNYVVRSNLLMASDFRSWTAHISAILDIKNNFWLGLGYRLGDSFSIMGGLKISDGFRIGYTFDLPTSQLIYKTFGSHEIFATYEFSFFRAKSKSIKSIRIL